MSNIRILSQGDVLHLMTLKDAIEADERAYRQKAAGKGSVWPMVFHEFERGAADLDIKSGDLAEDGVFGFKLVSWYGGNAVKGLPELFGTSMLFDIHTGAPVALINAGALTGMRTGAAAAVGAKYLARKDAETLLMLGTGMLAPYAVAATLICCPSIRRVIIANPRSPERAREKLDAVRSAAEALLSACNEHLNAELEASADLPVSVGQSDIIITATPSRTPVLRRAWVRPGTHISCLGADMSGKQELESTLIVSASVFVDDRQQSISVGECELPVAEKLISASHILGEIGQVINADIPGRVSPEQITVFDSSGIALQDIACCALLCNKAERQNTGHIVQI